MVICGGFSKLNIKYLHEMLHGDRLQIRVALVDIGFFYLRFKFGKHRHISYLINKLLYCSNNYGIITCYRLRFNINIWEKQKNVAPLWCLDWQCVIHFMWPCISYLHICVRVCVLNALVKMHPVNGMCISFLDSNRQWQDREIINLASRFIYILLHSTPYWSILLFEVKHEWNFEINFHLFKFTRFLWICSKFQVTPNISNLSTIFTVNAIQSNGASIDNRWFLIWFCLYIRDYTDDSIILSVWCWMILTNWVPTDDKNTPFLAQIQKWPFLLTSLCWNVLKKHNFVMTLFHRVNEFWHCHDHLFCRMGTNGQLFQMVICVHYSTHLTWGMDAFCNKCKWYITRLYRANVIPATTVAIVASVTTVPAAIAMTVVPVDPIADAISATFAVIIFGIMRTSNVGSHIDHSNTNSSSWNDDRH